MNILFLDQFSTPGGAQQCLCDLIPGVLERGWTAHVALPPGGSVATRLGGIGATVHELPLGIYSNGRKSIDDVIRFAWNTPRLAREIAALADRHRIDLLYVNGPRVLPAASLTSRRLIFHTHIFLNKAYARWLAGWSLRRCDAVIACSNFAAAPLRPHMPADRVHVVYNGVPDHGAVKASGSPRIGIIGRIAPEKGQLDFAHAARIVARAHPSATFVIVGAALGESSYEKRVRECARDLPVEFLGWQDDLSATFRELDLVVAPSSSVDAAPRVILEAFSAGIPVVAYAHGGIPELVEHGRTGLLTAEPTPESLAQALIVLLSDRPGLETLGRNARRVYEARFTVERFRREVVEIVSDRH